jgi:ribonuclease HI
VPTTILRNLGPGTSSGAEWLALIHALTIAHTLAPLDFVLIGDSADVIAKANGAVRCRASDLPYLNRLQTLAAAGPLPRIRLVKRSHNLAGIALAQLYAR